MKHGSGTSAPCGCLSEVVSSSPLSKVVQLGAWMFWAFEFMGEVLRVCGPVRASDMIDMDLDMRLRKHNGGSLSAKVGLTAVNATDSLDEFGRSG